MGQHPGARLLDDMGQQDLCVKLGSIGGCEAVRGALRMWGETDKDTADAGCGAVGTRGHPKSRAT